MNTADITCAKIYDEIIMKNPDWFNRVYLCYEDTNNSNTFSPIKGFKCYRYNSFETAKLGWNHELKNKNDQQYIRHTMIPICRWVPDIFDRYILNWKLREIYWLGKHTIYKQKKYIFK
jgi:hypothetical protein